MVPVAHPDLLIAVDGVDPAGFHRDNAIRPRAGAPSPATYETASPAISKTVTGGFEARGRKAERPLVVDSSE